MNKELIINVTSEEIAIALFEDKQLVELHKERGQGGYAVGDIYLGRVRKIMPGLNAAFVNVGHEKDGFIHYFDLGVHFTTLQRMVKQLVAGKSTSAFSNLKLEKLLPKSGKLADHLTSGDPILVQVAKEAISTKGPRLTSDISLAGRNVVLVPFGGKVSVSQKIRSKEERSRLKKIALGVLPRHYGVIIRTAAVGKQVEDLEQDITSLVERWEETLQNVQSHPIPSLVLGEMNRATTLIRDLLNGSFSSIHVNDATLYEEVREYIHTIAPEKEKIVKHYKGKVNIFDNFDVSRQLMSLFAKYVSLRKGAYLILEHTEALHVIDVNSGNRAKVDDDQERTALDVNLSAAAEVARQLRLRDLGGIIVVDFIDLYKAEHRNELYEEMRKLMASDRAKHTILPLSKFGLMQITRQRVRPETQIDVTELCPTCQGTGRVNPTLLMDEQIEKRIAYLTQEEGLTYLRMEVNPVLAAFLRRGIFSLRWRWMWRYRCRIDIEANPRVGLIEYKLYDYTGRELTEE